MAKPRAHHSSKSRGQQSANGPALASRPGPPWLPNLSQYTELQILSFKSAKDLDAAIDLLWAEDLRNLPHDTPDGQSLVVPTEAVDYFARAGLRFKRQKVLTITDLSAEEIRRLRG
jgi:hypothetical protein